MNRECACEVCVGGCNSLPGFFAPGEPEKAAAFLGVSLAELYGTRVEVLADNGACRPVIAWPDVSRSMTYHMEVGRCTFLTAEGRCEIHPVKPKECRLAMLCTDPPKRLHRRHNRILSEWKSGRTPEHGRTE
jgi:Fe-S-cluster containining protein